MLSGDLCMQLHHTVGIHEGLCPVAGIGEIGADRFDVGVQPAQDFQVVFVLVDGDQVGVALRFQFDQQILADQAGGTRNDDLACLSRISFTTSAV